jgi:hypothetical protein
MMVVRVGGRWNCHGKIWRRKGGDEIRWGMRESDGLRWNDLLICDQDEWMNDDLKLVYFKVPSSPSRAPDPQSAPKHRQLATAQHSAILTIEASDLICFYPSISHPINF